VENHVENVDRWNDELEKILNMSEGEKIWKERQVV
jgi:hypothetical protein